MSTTGAAIVTAAGIQAVIDAQATGRSIKPKRFGFSANEYTVDPMMIEIDNWHTGDISTYVEIDSDTVEFGCVVEPDQAAAYTKFVGIYLEDGTLFAIAKPPFALPPSLRQGVKVQISYSNITGVMNFEYIPTDEIEQWAGMMGNQLLAADMFLINAKERTGIIKIEGRKLK